MPAKGKPRKLGTLRGLCSLTPPKCTHLEGSNSDNVVDWRFLLAKEVKQRNPRRLFYDERRDRHVQLNIHPKSKVKRRHIELPPLERPSMVKNIKQEESSLCETHVDVNSLLFEIREGTCFNMREKLGQVGERRYETSCRNLGKFPLLTEKPSDLGETTNKQDRRDKLRDTKVKKDHGEEEELPKRGVKRVRFSHNTTLPSLPLAARTSIKNDYRTTLKIVVRIPEVSEYNEDDTKSVTNEEGTLPPLHSAGSGRNSSLSYTHAHSTRRHKTS